MKGQDMSATPVQYARKSAGLWTMALVAMAFAASPVAAQDGPLDKRVERLEKELRAVQRTVFPGGAPAFFEGEIAPDATPGQRSGTTPVTDLTARVDALESQLQTLTGQSEQNAFQLRELQKQFSAFKADVEKKLAAPVIPPAAAPATATDTAPAPVAITAAAVPAKKPAVATPAAAKPAAAKPAPGPATTAAKPNAARLALVKAVEIPATGNEAQDAYSYGYRLWDAKLYPEAQVELKKVVERWPSGSFASRAQNLLGRAYLDEGKPSLAAVAFYNNYKDRPSGDRAPHSLVYMGIALDKLGRKADACKAFREFDDVYGARAPKDVQADAAAAKTKAGC